MTNLSPSQTAQFLKRFRFHGGLLRRFSVRNRSLQETTAELLLTVSEVESGARVRLRLRFEGVEEYRFQRRPGPGLIRLREVRLGIFNGAFYLNLDAFADEATPPIHEYRASDAFVAGRTLAWETILPQPPHND